MYIVYKWEKKNFPQDFHINIKWITTMTIPAQSGKDSPFNSSQCYFTNLKINMQHKSCEAIQFPFFGPQLQVDAIYFFAIRVT